MTDSHARQPIFKSALPHTLALQPVHEYLNLDFLAGFFGFGLSPPSNSGLPSLSVGTLPPGSRPWLSSLAIERPCQSGSSVNRQYDRSNNSPSTTSWSTLCPVPLSPVVADMGLSPISNIIPTHCLLWYPPRDGLPNTCCHKWTCSCTSVESMSLSSPSKWLGLRLIS